MYMFKMRFPSNLRSLKRSLPARAGILAITALVALGLLPNARGTPQPSASGTLTETATSESFNTFAITLQNTGSQSLETFWFGEASGKDFLDSSPLSVSTPTGWTDSIHNTGGSDGYSIEFTTSTNPLAGSSNLSGFGFTSADSLSQMAASSTFYSGSAATYSVVTTGTNDTGNLSNPFIVVVAVPEPASVALLAGAFCAAFGFWKWRRRPPAAC